MLRTFGLLALVYTSLAFGKVYDCFMFFNEYDVLDIRFHEMYDYVDKFVIVESCETHAGNPKGFRFEKHLQRYAPFLDKVIYVKLHDRQYTENPWIRENWQRNQIMRGLVNCEPDDIILISDCDEIIPGEMIPELVKDIKDVHQIGFIQQLSAYRLNRLWTSCAEFHWRGTGCIQYKDLQHLPPTTFRESIHLGSGEDITWKEGGWHFSYMGGLHTNIEKCNNFAHCKDSDETYNPSHDEWRSKINRFDLVPIDNTFPQCVQDNVGYFIDIGLVDPY